MWLIIDGNNVIKSSAKTAPLRGKPFEQERDRFVEYIKCDRIRRRILDKPE